jgi:hypothetical protein
MSLPNIVIYNAFTFTSTTLNQSHNCIRLFANHLHACTTRRVKNHLYLQTQIDIYIYICFFCVFEKSRLREEPQGIMPNLPIF